MTMTLDATSGGFSGQVMMSCGSPLPAYVTCELPKNPIQLLSGSTASVRFEMDTDAVLNFWGPGNGDDPRTTGAGIVGLIGVGMLGWKRKRRWLMAVAIGFSVLGLTACGNKWPAHTPPGVYGIPVVATGTMGSATVQHTLNVQLTVTP
jgi:predicted small lipoprotein YifL